VPKAFCIPENPRGGRENARYDPNLPDIKTPRKATRAARIWARRTIAAAIEAARHAEPVDTLTSYLGFHGEKFRRNDTANAFLSRRRDVTTDPIEIAMILAGILAVVAIVFVL
jgi:hypothetical protein